MNLFTLPFLMGAPQGANGTPPTGMESFLSFAPFILIIAIFYFLIIRPQNKKQKETQKMLSALKRGDKVVTIGGVHGTIAAIEDGAVVVKVDDNVKIKFTRSAIATISSVAKEEKSEKDDKIEDKTESSKASDANSSAESKKSEE
jgi:preprotein translocase subunit YajC